MAQFQLTVQGSAKDHHPSGFGIEDRAREYVAALKEAGVKVNHATVSYYGRDISHSFTRDLLHTGPDRPKVEFRAFEMRPRNILAVQVVEGWFDHPEDVPKNRGITLDPKRKVLNIETSSRFVKVAVPGDWIVSTDEGLNVYSNEQFTRIFQECADE